MGALFGLSPLDWSIMIGRIKAAADRFDHCKMLVDSTGAGEPVFEELKKAGCRVEPYPFTHASKSALIDNLSLLLEQTKLVLPRPDIWPEGIDELEAFEFSVTEAGTVRTSAPSGAHDDCVIALALAAWLLPKSAGLPDWFFEQFEVDSRFGPPKDRITRWREM